MVTQDSISKSHKVMELNNDQITWDLSVGVWLSSKMPSPESVHRMNESNLHAPNLSLECLAMMKFQQVSTIYVNSSASGCKCRHASTYLLGPSCARLRTASNSSRSILDRPLIWSQYAKALLSRSFLVGPQMTGFLELRSARCFENAAFHICLLSWTWSFLLSLGYMCRRQTFVQTPALHNVLWFRKRTESMSVGQSQQRAKALLLTVSRCQPVLLDGQCPNIDTAETQRLNHQLIINLIEIYLELRLQVRKIWLALCKLSFCEDEYIWVFRVQVFYESFAFLVVL